MNTTTRHTSMSHRVPAIQSCACGQDSDLESVSITISPLGSKLSIRRISIELAFNCLKYACKIQICPVVLCPFFKKYYIVIVVEMCPFYEKKKDVSARAGIQE